MVFYIKLVNQRLCNGLIKTQLVLFVGLNQKNGGLSEYFGSICYPRERVQIPAAVSLNISIIWASLNLLFFMCRPPV